jgi:polyhydroxybutyrate depolymerase
MNLKNHLLLLTACLTCTLLNRPLPALATVTDRQWTVDNTKRTGILCTPDPTAHQPPAGWPVVFVFHGHGGSAQMIRHQFQIDILWPDAVVVYLQGLPTVGQITDPQGNGAGWDSIDTTDKNRDLRFYDTVLKDLTDNQHINPKRVFSTGHSNGGGFKFTLWAHRGDTLAAIAASSSIAALKDWPLLKPKPALMSSGRNDPLVKFTWQTRMIDYLKSLNKVSADGKPWNPNGAWYASDTGTPLATLIHDGGHPPPPDIGQRVVDFFKTVSPCDTK